MKRALVIVLLVALALPLLYAVSELPPHGSPDTPPYTHVSPRYLERGVEEAGAENIVTDVILNYRGFDTNGEVTVIFTALAAVLAVLLLDAPPHASRRPHVPDAIPASVVVRFIVRVLAPFIALFAIYVILNGHVTPGGGFQGGTIAGALFIVLYVVLGERATNVLLPRRAERLLQATAPLTFIVVGTIGILAFGSYLLFPQDPSLGWLRTLFYIVIEFGIGIGGAAVIATIFRTMEDER